MFIWFLTFGLQGVNAQELSIKKAEISFKFVSKDVQGTIAGFTSNSKIDLNTPENSVLSGSVDVATLDTNNSFRDWHLKRSKYFDAETYPEISFKSSKILSKGSKIHVTGTLKLKGTDKPLTLVFQPNGSTWTGTASIYSSDFGISIKKNREDNLVKITFRFEL